MIAESVHGGCSVADTEIPSSEDDRLETQKKNEENKEREKKKPNLWPFEWVMTSGGIEWRAFDWPGLGGLGDGECEPSSAEPGRRPCPSTKPRSSRFDSRNQHGGV